MSHDIEVIEGPYRFDALGGYVLSQKDGAMVGEVRGFGSLKSRYGEERACQIQDNTGRLLAESYAMWCELSRICNSVDDETKQSIMSILDRISGE